MNSRGRRRYFLNNSSQNNPSLPITALKKSQSVNLFEGSRTSLQPAARSGSLHQLVPANSAGRSLRIHNNSIARLGGREQNASIRSIQKVNIGALWPRPRFPRQPRGKVGLASAGLGQNFPMFTSASLQIEGGGESGAARKSSRRRFFGADSYESRLELLSLSSIQRR